MTPEELERHIRGGKCNSSFPPAVYPGRNLRSGVIRAAAAHGNRDTLDHRLMAAGRLSARELADGSVVFQVEKELATEIRVGGDDGLVTVTASTGHTDRMGDIIDPAGWELGPFKANPVILVDHSYRVADIVGHAVSARVEGLQDDARGAGDRPDLPGRLVLDIRLDPPESSESVDLVRSKLASGSLRTVSVGFRALDWNWIRDGDDRVTGILFSRQELLENSFVAVPANASAVVHDSAKSVELSRFFAEVEAKTQMARLAL